MQRNHRILIALTGLMFILPSMAGAHVALSEFMTSGDHGYTLPNPVGSVGVQFRGTASIQPATFGSAPWGGSATQGGNLGFTSASQVSSAYRELSVIAGNPRSTTVTIAANDLLTPVPEPASLILLGSGLLGLAGAYRRKKATSK
jgi:hypothetical protein